MKFEFIILNLHANNGIDPMAKPRGINPNDKMYYKRNIEPEILRSIANNPVTAILGPRQCGKSTLARQIAIQNKNEYIYLDLERPSELQKLDHAEWFLGTQKGKLICLDEIQRKPELFPLIRSLVDEWGGNGHFLILGSASRDLLKQSSESLAGRISYKRLTPFLFEELKDHFRLQDFLSRGGFPRSLLATDNKQSYDWRLDFISTFLERDLLLWSGFSPETMHKLWQMLANLNGQLVNSSRLGSSLGVSHTTVRNYIELLGSTFMLQMLPPYLVNQGKRLVKSPKIYLNDIGIANALLQVPDFELLAGHPSFGSAWEALVLNNLSGTFPQYKFSFYRTSHGAEIDFIIENGPKRIAVECKGTLTPKLNIGTFTAIEDIQPLACLVVTPIEQGWQMKKDIFVASISEAIGKIGDLLE